jgi:uncharacterized protein YbaR (Trm112 family)
MTYRIQWAELVCPHCHQDLAEVRANAESALKCAGCQRVYPVVCGIPDLRTFPDPYISFEGDRTKARMLYSRFGDLDFEGLVELYYHVTPETPPKDVALNTGRLVGAVGRGRATLDAWSKSFGEVAGERLLDVGCGGVALRAPDWRRRRDALAGGGEATTP